MEMTSNLKNLRAEKGETQLQLAQLLGLKTASAYSKKETGRVPLTVKEVKILSVHYEKPISFFCQ
jgi:transcriptional regulator with XRE-family HTH domain